MGNQTYVVLQCCECCMFQAQIDKRSRSFSCNVCHTKQGYSRVFAKSNVAKDLRPIVAEYNAKGVADREAVGEEPEEPGEPGEPREPEELPLDAGQVGVPREVGQVWDEFVQDSDDDGELQDRRLETNEDWQEKSATVSLKRTLAGSEWERDSDARRIEAQRARFAKHFAKKPREKRTANLSRRGFDTVARQGGEQDADRGNTADQGNTADRRRVRAVDEKLDSSDAVGSPVGAKSAANNGMNDTAWDEFLSD